MGYAGTLILYLAIICIATALTSIAYSSERDRVTKGILIFAVIFILAFFAGARYQVGADWNQYYSGVTYVGEQGNTGWGEDKENYGLLYILICRLVYILGGNGSMLLFVMGFLTYLFLFLTLDRMKDTVNVSGSIFLYTALYYLVSYNIVRQALGITIGMYAISFMDLGSIDEDGSSSHRLLRIISNNAKYFIWSAVSVMAHNAGYMCFLALPLCYFMRKRKTKWIILGAVLVAVINYRNFMQLALTITGIESFRWYFNIWGEEGSYVLYLLKYAPFILSCGFAYNSIRDNPKIYDMYNLFLVGYIINALSVRSNTEIERVGFVFLYMIIIVVPYALKNINSSNGIFSMNIRFSVGASGGNIFYNAYKIFMYAYIIFFFYYYFFMSGSYRVVPYNFIF